MAENSKLAAQTLALGQLIGATNSGKKLKRATDLQNIYGNQHRLTLKQLTTYTSKIMASRTPLIRIQLTVTRKTPRADLSKLFSSNLYLHSVSPNPHTETKQHQDMTSNADTPDSPSILIQLRAIPKE
ncbi:exportin-2 [Dorcoceras hygrometricum]|uniref:Exportin-2 n=1 Tax=Dorcoceras hygrometricum TaxID=472368 RepID=A0A2Z7B6M1_9LAMI|nr:exportin-2 [Dorcoceras hygrometricum]